MYIFIWDLYVYTIKCNYNLSHFNYAILHCTATKTALLSTKCKKSEYKSPQKVFNVFSFSVKFQEIALSKNSFEIKKKLIPLRMLFKLVCAIGFWLFFMQYKNKQKIK